MFSDDQPMFLNYMTLGFVIGHAFDAFSSQLDQHGTYYIIVWKRLLKRKTLKTIVRDKLINLLILQSEMPVRKLRRIIMYTNTNV